MEKLIELLNEYEAKRHKTSVIANIRKGEDRLSYLEMNWNYSELLCISKGYEFIKWLVDNGKTNREKIPSVIKVDGYLADGSDTEYYDMEESLLMLLSISDNPIEYLVSILK